MSVWNTLNIYYTDSPFLASEQSDSTRHLWFDWQSRRSSLEIQPSSVARYLLFGVPYSTKNFEYPTQAGDELNDIVLISPRHYFIILTLWNHYVFR
jgi:hypothetical protein